jgi:hypothetical protein
MLHITPDAPSAPTTAEVREDPRAWDMRYHLDANRAHLEQQRADRGECGGLFARRDFAIMHAARLSGISAEEFVRRLFDEPDALPIPTFTPRVLEGRI